jgi:uncharacterized membrane protein YdbT with pleckstrin-like domain
MPNEKILFSARIHPAIFLRAIFLFLVAVASGVYVLSLTGKTTSDVAVLGVMMLCFTGLFLFFSLIAGLQALILITTTEFAITNRRVIAKTGFIRRHTLEMLLNKIESVAVHQDIIARLLNFGSVTVTGTGGTRESFKAIAEPIEVRSKINQIIEQSTQAFSQQQRALNHENSG